MKVTLIDDFGPAITAGFVGAGMVAWFTLCLVGAHCLTLEARRRSGLPKVFAVLAHYALALLGAGTLFVALLHAYDSSIGQVFAFILGAVGCAAFFANRGLFRRESPRKAQA